MNGGQVALRANCGAANYVVETMLRAGRKQAALCFGAQRLENLGSAGLCLGAHASGGQLHVLVAALERA
jgi:hypothetical protein